jgi:hypothetical protein
MNRVMLYRGLQGILSKTAKRNFTYAKTLVSEPVLSPGDRLPSPLTLPYTAAPMTSGMVVCPDSSGIFR